MLYKGLDVIVCRELLPLTRLQWPVNTLQLLFDRAQGVLGKGMHIDYFVSAAHSDTLLYPFDERIVDESIQDVHETILVLPKQS